MQSALCSNQYKYIKLSKITYGLTQVQSVKNFLQFWVNIIKAINVKKKLKKRKGLNFEKAQHI